MSLLDAAERQRVRALVESMHTDRKLFELFARADYEQNLREWLQKGYDERDLLFAYVDFLQSAYCLLVKDHERLRERWHEHVATWARDEKEEIPWKATQQDRQARTLWNDGLRTETPEMLDDALVLWHLVAAEKRNEAPSEV